MVEFAQTYSKELTALVAVVLGYLISTLFRLRPRLVYGVRNSWNYLVDQPLLNQAGEQLLAVQGVRTASIFLENVGLLPAKAVEITFNWKPPIFNVWPARHYETVTGDLNRFTIKLDSLAPSEFFAVEIMSINSELPIMTAVRSEGSVGKAIEMSPQRVWPSWFLRWLMLLLLLGVATAFYLIAIAVHFLAGGSA